MQLGCPSCHTAFYVDPAAFGAEGRTVRCARCRHTWLARAEDLIPDPALAGGDDGTTEALAVDIPAARIQPVVEWNDMVMVEVPSSPPLSPEGPQASTVPQVQSAAEIANDIVATERRRPARSGRNDTRLGLVALLLGLIVVLGFTAREPLVGAVPSLAGFFAAAGLPVNLRGIEFHDLRTSFESQDNREVLVIEGELLNPTRYTRDIPRLRFAILGADGDEVYSWTALLPRETLTARESLTFRSRLASPPEAGTRVSVRFLSPADLTGAN